MSRKEAFSNFLQQIHQKSEFPFKLGERFSANESQKYLECIHLTLTSILEQNLNSNIKGTLTRSDKELFKLKQQTIEKNIRTEFVDFLRKSQKRDEAIK